jgi:hypothetical protein
MPWRTCKEERKLTIVTEQEVGLDAIDGNRSDGPEVVPLVDKLQVWVGRVEETLGVERLEIDDLEPFRAADAKLSLEEVD